MIFGSSFPDGDSRIEKCRQGCKALFTGNDKDISEIEWNQQLIAADSI